MWKKKVWLTALLVVLVAGACDRLDDGDVMAETLPGRWSFSYKTDEPIDYELSYKLVIFNTDGTCALTYTDGQLEGTYRASSAVIRIEATTSDGQDRSLLWRVLEMSPYRVVAEYEHQFSDDRRVKMTVMLDKL